MTKTIINRSLKRQGLDLTVEGERGDGCFYFLNSLGDQVGDTVMVCYLNQLSLCRWIALAKSALKD